MSCGCRICVQGRQVKAHLQILNDAGMMESVKFFEGIYDELLNLGLDNDVNKSIIEGSWPTADEQIKAARERYQKSQEETK